MDMSGTITKTLIGVIAVVSGSFTPVFPDELTPGLSAYPDMRGYQYPVGSDRAYYSIVDGVVVRGGPLPDADFVDEDGNGIISVGTFTDIKGQDVYVKIPDEQYAKMGLKDGQMFNPTKTDYVSLIDKITPKVDAAIAVDATSEGYQAAGTSLTFSHTVTGSDTGMVRSLFIWNGTISGLTATYDSESMTSLISRAADVGQIHIFGMAGANTGTHNVVYTNANSVQMFDTGASYTGVDQTTPFPDTETSGSSAGTSFSPSITTSVDQSWPFLNVRSPSRNASAGASTVERKQNTTSGDAASSFDSDAGRSTGSNSLTYTISPSATTYWVMTAFAPAAAGGGGGSTTTPGQNIILFE